MRIDELVVSPTPADVTGARCSLTGSMRPPWWARPVSIPCLDRHARPNQAAERGVRIEDHLHPYPLHHLGEVAGGVVGRQQRERAAGAGGPAINPTRQHEVRERIHCDARPDRRALPRVIWVSLKFAITQMLGNGIAGDHLRANIDELTGPHLTLPDHPIDRRDDARIAKGCCAPGSPVPRRRAPAL